MDKGIKRVLEVTRGINSKKKPQAWNLKLSEESFSRKVSSDCIIVENYFGRHFSLWNLLGKMELV